MPRRLTEKRLLVASHNPGKVREIADLVRPLGIAVVAAADVGAPEPEESEASFRDNAVLKALSAARHAGLPALADDSGLVVPALGGAPGLHSARWAGPGKDFASAMTRLWRALEEAQVPADGRQAHFVCALALAWPDGHVEAFEGRIDGRLVWPMRGTRGFGYDPIFVPEGHQLTFGEMDPEVKHGLSHRARAFAQLRAACLD
jgi:XTP/dITP diphosphohydrolase